MLKVNEINIEEFIEYKSKLSSSHLKRGHFFYILIVFVYMLYMCVHAHGHMCVLAHVSLYHYMWRPEVDVRNHL